MMKVTFSTRVLIRNWRNRHYWKYLLNAGVHWEEKGHKGKLFLFFLFKTSLERNLIQRNVNKWISRHNINIVPIVPEDII